MDQNYTLPVGLSINTGSWAALDPAACKTIWQVTHPSKDFDIASVTSDNGIVYVGSMTGNAYPLDAATGAVVWFVKEVQSSNAAPAIVGGTVFWWSGYYPARTSGQYPDRRAVRIFRRRALA